MILGWPTAPSSQKEKPRTFLITMTLDSPTRIARMHLSRRRHARTLGDPVQYVCGNFS